MSPEKSKSLVRLPLNETWKVNPSIVVLSKFSLKRIILGYGAFMAGIFALRSVFLQAEPSYFFLERNKCLT